MKILMTLLIAVTTSLTFAQGPQTWPDAFSQEDVDVIKKEVTSLLLEDEFDAAVERMQFPFRIGKTTYSKKELKEKFSEFFTAELCRELATSEFFEVTSPDGDGYMIVCLNAPDGFTGAVPLFKRINDVWMLIALEVY